ncbi:helix-turn-helix domain-containing protein [Exiguobacterium antarcticum]|uniref:helix-turn-helix domain-containing protein n=1 Tax=Exiguobacterium antarcticum TaxID=132920 RepID=UPI000551EDC0|nr:helix-turn-helix domain-containing protein [Exiguobacterium antarcticum]
MQQVVMLSFTPEQLMTLIDERIAEALANQTAKGWLTEKEAQTYTGFSQFVLYNARMDGELKASKCNRSIRYHRDDLDAWLISKQK